MNNIAGNTAAVCRPQLIAARGEVTVQATLRQNLTHCEYNRLWDKTAASEKATVLVCSWRGGEPIIHGFGDDTMSAWRMAQTCVAGTKYKDDALEICDRIEGEKLVWRGPSGRVVTVEHHRSLDN